MDSASRTEEFSQRPPVILANTTLSLLGMGKVRETLRFQTQKQNKD